MSYQILSRRYRPQRFDDVSGQQHVRRVLTGAIRNRRVGQAFLFLGPRGVGKTTMARILARALNCEAHRARWDDDATDASTANIPIEPCGECPSCKGVAASSDLDVIEMDAASNNHVEDVRTLRERVGYAAARSPFRIWIVDEVHMLSRAAFDAFLKTLEEPPPWVKFIFCTTEAHKLPATFRSRCSLLEFRALDTPTLAKRITRLAANEDVKLEDGLADAIARAARGGMRDAESMLEQLLAVHASGILTRNDFDMLCGRLSAERMSTLMDATHAADANRAIDILDEAIADGAKPGVVLDQWLDAWRTVMVGTQDERQAPAMQVRACQAMEILLAKRAHLRTGADGSLLLHVAAVELARLPTARDLDALLSAVHSLSSPSGNAPRVESRDAQSRPASPTHTETRPRHTEASSDSAVTTPLPPAPSQSSRSDGPPLDAAKGDTGGTGGANAQARSSKQTSTTASRSGVAVVSKQPTTSDKPLLRAADVQAKWEEIVDVAAKKKPALAPLLDHVSIRGVKGQTVHISVDPDAVMARQAFVRPEYQMALGQLLRDVCGQFLRPVVVAEGPRHMEGLIADDARHDPTIANVVQRVNGQLLWVKDVSDRKGAR